MWKVKRMNTACIVVLTPSAWRLAGVGAGSVAGGRARPRRLRRRSLASPTSNAVESIDQPINSTCAAKAQRRPLRRRQPERDAEVTERTHDMKCRGNQPMMRTLMVRALSFSAVAALTLNPALTPVVASDYRAAAAPVAADGQMNARFLSLGIGKSIVIDLPRDIKDVLVADPKIANAVVRSAQRAYIIGAAVGQTNIVFFDSAGQQIAAYDIAVKRDLNGVRAALKQTLPNSDIQIEGVGDGVVLTGTAASPIEAQQAGDLAARLVGGADKVVNSIAVRGRDQVMLKVTVAEVQRSIIKQLGIDLSRQPELRHGGRQIQQHQPVHGKRRAAGRRQRAHRHRSARHRRSQATLRAMESAGVVRTLAEPNLTAISGESATFISGGEFPIPTGVTCQTTRSRRSLKLRPDGQLQEIRHLAQLHAGGDDRGPDQPAGDDRSVGSLDRKLLDRRRTGGTTIPSIKTRRAETTLEIPSGGAMAMAGLIQEQTKQAINGFRGCRNCRCSARCSAAATSSTTRPN